jgi:hypothetical protein
MRRWIPLALLLVAGCKPDSYTGHGLTWTPPHGVKLQSDSDTTATFNNGIQFEVKPLGDLPADADEGHLQDVIDKLVPQGVKMFSKRAGTLPAGKVIRLVWLGEGGRRTLLYYLPSKDKLVLLTLSGSESAFNTMESTFDLSLNSLKVQ